MTGINQVLKMCWSIISKTEDEKTKLQALSLINDCNKYKIDLSTNGVVITDAIKYVNGKMDHLNNQEKKLLEDGGKALEDRFIVGDGFGKGNSLDTFKEEIARLDKEAKASSSLLLLLTWALS